MAQLVVQPNQSLINADNSSDDVQDIGYTPTKSSTPTYYNQRPNEVVRAHVNESDDAINKAQITPLSRRGSEGQKKLINSQIMTTDAANRKLESAKTSSYQSGDDKSLELKKTADSQLTSILNISDFKPNEIGGINPLIFFLLSNQPQLALGNPYSIGSLLTAQNAAIFPQNYGSFSQLSDQDYNSLLYNAHNGGYFSNGATCLSQLDSRSLPQSVKMSTPTIEDHRKQQLSPNTQQIAVSQQTKSACSQMHQSGHCNTDYAASNDLREKRYETSLLATEETMDIEPVSSSKAIKRDVIEGLDSKKRKVRQCFNIYCQTDPENALLWSKTRVTGKMSCKVCEEAWKKQQYCYFCKQVYLEEGDAFDDPKPWIGCDSCERWTHTECEDKTLQKRIKWHQQRKEDFEYKCPSCRAKARNSGRGKPRRSFPQPNETLNLAIEHPIHDELQGDFIRKQVKMSPKSPENKCGEFNPNSNSNLIILEESCLAMKKLENVFNKHMQKKKPQIGKPTVQQIDFFSVIDNLLTQHGKKLQLAENEVQNDLMMMREACRMSSANTGSFMEEENIGKQSYESPKNRNGAWNYIEEDEKKAGGLTQSRARGSNAKRNYAAQSNNYDLSKYSFHKDYFDSEHVPGSQASKRQPARNKRYSE